MAGKTNTASTNPYASPETLALLTDVLDLLGELQCECLPFAEPGFGECEACSVTRRVATVLEVAP